MSRHSRGRRDPTADNGLRLVEMRDDLLGQFLNTALTDREKVVIVAALYYLAAPGYLPDYRLNSDEAERVESIARSKLRAYGPREIQDAEEAALSMLRTYGLARPRAAGYDDYRDGPQRDIWDDRSPVKSALIQELAEQLMEYRGSCSHCGEEMWRWRAQFGRSRSYCSNACRQAAYRLRQAK